MAKGALILGDPGFSQFCHVIPCFPQLSPKFGVPSPSAFLVTGFSICPILAIFGPILAFFTDNVPKRYLILGDPGVSQFSNITPSLLHLPYKFGVPWPSAFLVIAA